MLIFNDVEIRLCIKVDSLRLWTGLNLLHVFNKMNLNDVEIRLCIKVDSLRLRTGLNPLHFFKKMK